jgi:hypothetical protein
MNRTVSASWCHFFFLSPRLFSSSREKGKNPKQPNQKKQNPNSKSPLLPFGHSQNKGTSPIDHTQPNQERPNKIDKIKKKKKLCNQLLQQPNQKLQSSFLLEIIGNQQYNL